MANILFKKGLSSALPWKSAEEGAFYLTTDTNRLYVGQDAGKLAEINRYVKVIDNLSQLPDNPHQDDFVYISDKNILAVCTNPTASGAGKWTQINPDTDTNTNTYLTRADSKVELKPVSTSPDDDRKKIVVTLDLYNSIKDELTPEVNATEIETPVKASFEITKDMISTVNETNIGLNTGTATNGATISLSGPGADEKNLSIDFVSGSNVTITGDNANDKVTISANDTTYNLTTANESNNAYLVLEGSDNSKDKIKIQTGNDAITASVGTTGYIDYTHKAYTTTKTEKKDVEGGAKESIALNHSGSFTAITGLTADKGHVTGYTVQTYNLPEDENTTYEVKEISANDSGQITVSLKSSDSANPVLTTSNADLYYTVNGETVYNQGTIDFYTKNELDQKFYAIDAMTYKGTVSKVGDLPTSNVHNGDTYKVAKAGTYSGHVCTVGDLLIATGEELMTEVELETGETLEAGTIKLDTLVWTYIPSGNDTDTHYDLTLQNNIISLSNDVDSEVDNVLFKAGEDLVATTTPATTSTSPTLTYSHKTYSAPAVTPSKEASNLLHGGSFTVIDGITASNGHITGYSTKTFNLPTDEDTTYTLDGSVADATDKKGVVVTDKLTKTGEATSYTSSVIGYSSNTLKITTGTKANDEDARVTINLEWGSF